MTGTRTEKIVKLTFSAPVHFGAGRLTDSEYTCAADTLFSALFLEALAQGTQEGLFQAVQNNDLLISDAFPWIADTYYLPKPYYSAGENKSAQRAADNDGDSDSDAKKAFKKLNYIAAEKYAEYFDGSFKACLERDKWQKNPPGSDSAITKVNLSRENSDKPELYQVGTFRFKENAGLYFMMRGTYDITPLLESLRYSGLGGKRSSGYGRFDYEIGNHDFELPTMENSEMPYVLLSSAAPRENELSDELLEGAAYALKRKSGFVQSENYADTFSKKWDFYTFAAGSTFFQKFTGYVFDVGCGGTHPVWRYAKAFWLEG